MKKLNIILTIAFYVATSFPPFGGTKGSCQTTVCSGDSVVLILNGYQGTIQWQQSPDLTTWSPASGVTAINDTLYLTATNSYYYRAEVTDGSCLPFYSDTTLVTTVNSAPAVPTANSASGVSQASFSANWTTSSSATTYYLDVATDAGFTSFVSGYNALNMGNVSAYSVTGLACNTSYYYRVSASNACGASGNSGTIDVTTSATTPPAPTANAASNIATSFDANWTTSSDASTYYLDVATDADFTSFVSGYNALNVGNVSAYSVTGLACNTTYYYRVRAYNACGASGNSNTITVTTSSLVPAAPTANAASTVTPSSFSANWATSSGASTYYLDVSTNVGFSSFVTGYNNLNVGNVTTYNVTGLVCNTAYYYRVRANSCGTSQGSNTVTVTVPCAAAPYCTVSSTCSGNLFDSRDSKTYATVQIVNQCWMAENLNVGTYVTGNIDQTSGSDNQNSSIEKYCYGNNTANCNTYGGLYQWNEMMAYQPSVNTNGPGPQGICPTGWHIPTDNEWKCLEMNLGMTQSQADYTGLRGTDEGGKLKQTGTTLWLSPNTGATNSSGFTALPGGGRPYNGSFIYVREDGYWWTATESNALSAWDHHLYCNYAQVNRYSTPSKLTGFSVRCVKD